MNVKILKKSSFILLIAIFVFSFIACEKTEGEGGTSSIYGKVRVKELKSGKEYYAQEERVYIIYGDDITYSDDVRTHHDGTYRFSFLRKGTYQVFAYSKDTTGEFVSGTKPIIKTVIIKQNNQHIEVEDILIIN